MPIERIYRILSGRNIEQSNVKYFDDVPVELLPGMMGSIQQYSEYHYVGYQMHDQDDGDCHVLSIVYEVMRRWDKVFSVYEALNLRLNNVKRGTTAIHSNKKHSNSKR